MRAALLLPLLITIAMPATATDPLQLVQTGDREKSCPILAEEINGLATTAAPAAAPRRKGFGFGKALGIAMPVLGSAVPMLGVLGGTGGAAVMQAASVAGTVGSRSSAQATVATAQADADATMLRAERKQRLLAIFEEKHC